MHGFLIRDYEYPTNILCWTSERFQKTNERRFELGQCSKKTLYDIPHEPTTSLISTADVTFAQDITKPVKKELTIRALLRRNKTFNILCDVVTIEA
ncbi:hypothetical protein QVD17_29656 [Tagetes erecta]|uniref:Uncharacterized protein n=1 Tax=Tagetes erecta TaxID=13708 RepID=A0AAD8K001_TARER|nr:hypothetical protein QVD17_29656 [Tagetes erecta]